MRAIFGLVLVMVGLAMAVSWMPERDGARELAIVTDIATKVTPGVQVRAGANGSRTFSPQTPLVATVEPRTPRPAHNASVARVVEEVSVDSRPSSVGTAAHISVGLPVRQHPAAAATVIDPALAAGGGVRVSEATAAARAAVTAEMGRDELVRSLQRELKRVGCYYGEVDGDWGVGSRRAMAAFTDRVNASLPLDRPDFIQLTLLRGHAGVACGRGCPSGQVAAAGGRCIPAAIVAQTTSRYPPRTRADEAPPAQSANHAGTRTDSASSATASIATGTLVTSATPGREMTVSPLPGRMAVGGPQSGTTILPPPERTAAADAVRAADAEQARIASPQRRRSARRPQVDYYGFRAVPPPAYVYRQPPPPRYYAARPTSRRWTATFFGNP